MNSRTASYWVAIAGGQVHLLEIGHREHVHGRRQARHRVLLLAAHPERGATRDDRGQPRRSPEELADDRPAVDDLLEVVEDEEGLLGCEPLREDLPGAPPAALDEAERRQDRACDQARIADGLEGHEPDAVGISVRDVRGELEGQSRLAGPTRSGERQQSCRLEEALGLGQLGVPTDEARQLRRQVVRATIEGPDRREVGPQAVDHELADALRAEVLQAVLA